MDDDENTGYVHRWIMMRIMMDNQRMMDHESWIMIIPPMDGKNNDDKNNDH